MWELIIEYGRIAKEKCEKLIKWFPFAKGKTLKRFDKSWGKIQVLCVRVVNFIKWLYNEPCWGYIWGVIILTCTINNHNHCLIF